MASKKAEADKAILYHITKPERAEAILRHGFADAHGRYMANQEFDGVFLLDRPLDAYHQGDYGDDYTILAVTFSVPLSALAKYEWVEEGAPKSYREWCIPEEVIQELASVSKSELTH
jgi:hypothetical protein